MTSQENLCEVINLLFPRYRSHTQLPNYCSIQEGLSVLGGFSLILNCFKVDSSEVWFPEKYADTAL